MSIENPSYIQPELRSENVDLEEEQQKKLMEELKEKYPGEGIEYFERRNTMLVPDREDLTRPVHNAISKEPFAARRRGNNAGAVEPHDPYVVISPLKVAHKEVARVLKNGRYRQEEVEWDFPPGTPVEMLSVKQPETSHQ